MQRLSKNQVRLQKTAKKLKDKEERQRRINNIAAERLKRANRKLFEAVEIAVARIAKKFDVDDLSARSMLAEILSNKLLVDDEIPVAKAQSINKQPNVLKKQGFDKSAWNK